MVDSEYSLDGIFVGDDEAFIGQYSGQPSTDVSTVPAVHDLASLGPLIAKSALETKVQARHIQNHHGAMQMFIANMSLAKNLGFTDDERSSIVPFPSPSKSVVINDNGSQQMGAIAMALITALGSTLNRPVAPTTQSEQPVSIQPDTIITAQPDTAAAPAVSDSMTIKVIPKDDTSPVVTPTPTTGTLKPTPLGWAALAVLGASLFGGGGYYYYNHQASTTVTTPPAVTAPANPVDGKIGVTIE